MRVRLVHTTRLDYTADVSEGVMDVRLGPHSDADQRWDSFALAVEPAASVRGYTDGFGNRAHLITLVRPHRTIEVVARATVTTLLDDPEAPARAPEPLAPAELADYLHPSRLVPAVPALGEAAAAYRPATPAEAFGVVRRLSHLVRERLDYRPGATTVTTAVPDVLALGAGVCQDFSHVLIALCRAAGVPARYVSGYLVAGAAPGAEAPRGDPQASHAWVEAFTPTHGWRGFDPTNGVLAGPAHVKVAVGRDYGDVPPTRGAFRGTAEERLTVHVESGRAD
jgi:transglutaminase-like putative cysteine protease